ncbi:2-oxoacid:acceptor oxidoreductase family protein [Patescibacteria group bacterium]|nr:2-oxoacid:acceptor oxidoreductase family protein [Patescibacteria group bacterium]
MFEIRIHSRGGQGAKTIGQILAEAAIEDGKFTEAFAEYGPERSGAPMQVFVRVSDKPILVHSNVKNPDIVILADSSLLGLVDVLGGLKSNGAIIINTAKNPDEIKSLIKAKKAQKIYSLDATKIAVETLGKDFSGIALMGALNKITGIVSKAALEEELEEIFSRKKGKEVAEKNINAFRKGYESIIL